MNSPPFEQCIEMLRSKDSLTYEDGYQWLQGYLESRLSDIIALMKKETDADVRSKLVELIGNSKSPKVIPYLEQELKSEFMEVRSWAYSSLLYFDDPNAQRIAEAFKIESPKEDFL
jgi:HEAT repeat protein